MDPGLRRRQRRDKIYDKLHRGFVRTCMSVTIIGSFLIGYQVYEYFRYVRPLRKAQNKISDEELLSEGKSIEPPSNIEFST